MGLLVLVPVGVEERIVLIGVPVWPTIDGDANDVGCWIEAAWAQGARELVADVPLEDLKACVQQFGSADPILLPVVEAGFAGRAYHMDENRIVWRSHAYVAANIDCLVKPD